MAETTIDNKKISLTNRMAVVIIGAIIAGTFSATTFYHQSRFQDLVTSANKEKIDALETRLKNAEDDFKARAAMLQAEFNAKEVALRAYTDRQVEQEVGGLRGDWERKNQEQRELHARHEKEIDGNRALILDRHAGSNKP